MPSAAIGYAKLLQTSAKKIHFQFAECSYRLCKDKNILLKSESFVRKE
ncbi:hypothetical protein HMPREF0653_02236 [Prevotella disiens JCM 6334 = ATCC 29426]|uniref:Uncharacterized protein n=1 Tax=Prevotella disiens JCM 6334 = ATCC 29426 TaxID=1235811 RepID=A0ABN0NPR0_9BACT|nr:hypothetical protein HMPREF0653_02236 [Prevotella disiens JCM 6334 = ATCC 29426]